MYFLASYVVNGLRGILSPDMMVVTPQFLLFGVLCILPLAIELFTLPAYRKRHAELEAAGFFEQD